MISIETADSPAANGHYSQAVSANGFLFLATQLPLSPSRPGELPGDVEGQCRQAIANCRAILAAAGASLSDVVSVNIFAVDIADWPIADAAMADAFGSHRPARGVFGVNALHLGARIAVQMVAVAGDQGPPGIANQPAARDER